MATQPKIPWTPQRQAQLVALLRTRNPGVSDDRIAGNEGNRQISSGIVGDLFNILGRPSRAVAGAVYNSVDKDPTSTAVGGITSGLTGHGEHNFSDVLGELGVKNRAVKAIGGFGLDVALDPLTYVGIKGEKGLNATEALASATKRTVEADVAPHLFGDAVERAAAQLQAENPSHLYATFAGKKISPNVVTPSKVANVIKNTIVGPESDRSSLAKMFSRQSELPHGLAQKARVYESGNSAAFQAHRDAVRDLFKGVHSDDAKNITFALDEGADLSSVPLTNGPQRDGFNTQGDYARVVRKIFDEYHADEVKLGLRAPDSYVDNYMYRFFPNGLPEAYPGLSKAAVSRAGKMGLPEDLAKLSMRQLSETKDFSPLTDIGQILEQRSASHYRNIGRAELVLDAINPERPGAFAVQATDNSLEGLKKMGWLDVGEHVASPAAAQFKGKGVFAAPEIVKVLNQTERILTDNQVGGNFVKWYDKITHKWKMLNTVVNPGYWTRNSMSDGIMNFMDGVRNPKHYDQAFRVLTEHRSNNTAEMLAGLGEEALAGPIKRGTIDFGGELRVPANKVYADFLRAGGKSGDIQTNITGELDDVAREGLGKVVNKTSQAGAMWNKGEAKLADWGNMREDYFRLSHFLSATEDQMRRGMPYEQAIMKAGERVRKYNIDYGALSSFEKQYMRRAIPFYSWMRRNTPLQVELMLTRPGFMAGYSKGNDLMQGLLGTEDGSGDYMVPKWIRDSAPVRVALGNNKSSNPIDKLIRTLSGAKQGESVFMPTINSMTPVGDIAHLTKPIQDFKEAGGVGNPGGALIAGGRAVATDLVNMSTPLVKMPVEAAIGRSTFSGAPIEGDSAWRDWLISQISGGVGRTVLNTGAGGEVNPHGLTSSLLGLQIQPVTQPRQKSEFRRREDVVQGLPAYNAKGTRAAQWRAYLKKSRKSVGA